jgi:hypothetical protein
MKILEMLNFNVISDAGLSCEKAWLKKLVHALAFMLQSCIKHVHASEEHATCQWYYLINECKNTYNWSFSSITQIKKWAIGKFYWLQRAYRILLLQYSLGCLQRCRKPFVQYRNCLKIKHLSERCWNMTDFT